MKKILIVLLLVVVVAVGAWLFTWRRSPKIGHVKDEAQLAGLTADYFNAADEKEYLRDMDRGPWGPGPCTSATWTGAPRARLIFRRMRSKGATPGSCGRRETTGSGTS